MILEKMKHLFFFCLLLLTSSSFAQTFPFDLWHDGKVVLEGGDTIKGTIKYDLQDLLQVRHNQRLESYSARKVIYYEIFDVTYKRYRQFYSLPYSATGGYKSPVFFEVLTEGKLTVLSREKIEIRSNNYSPYYSPYGFGSYGTRKILVNTYYLLKENGNIEEFSGKRNDWLDLMGNHADAVHDFAKDNRLAFDRKYDVKRIVEYYNSLVGPK